MTHSANSRASAFLKGAVAAAAIAILPATALAQAKAPAKAPACYNRKEHAAEQMVRLHTELMVIGLTCQSIFPEHNTFVKYQEFTIKNRAMLSEAEGALISHFQRNGGGGTNRFDTYRTELANQISRRVGVIGSYSYCQQFIPRANNALAMPQADLKLLASNEKEAGLMHLGSRPLCDVKVASLPDAMGPVTPPRGKATPAKTTVAAKPVQAKPVSATKPAAAKPAAKAPAKSAATAKPAKAPAKTTVAQR